MSVIGGIARSRTSPIRVASFVRKAARQQEVNPYPVDTSAALQYLVSSFSGEAIRVSFRQLVSWIKVGERGTHYLHSYPAKLLPQIAHFFLAASSLSRRGDLVLDPFGGTGTVALEAILAGKRAIQADANPLARLIAQTKTQLLGEKELKEAFVAVHNRYKLARAGKPPDVVNIDYWYSPEDIRALSRLQSAISGETRKHVRDFLLVTFSACARKASKADLRFSVPVRKKKFGFKSDSVRPTVWGLFDEQFHANLMRQAALRSFSPKGGPVRCAGFDARNLRTPGTWDEKRPRLLGSDSVDLIITSPPYAGAQKYVRASSLSLGWLGLAARSELRALERESIGREHFAKAEVDACPLTGFGEADEFIRGVSERNSRRGVIIATYLREMRSAFDEAVRVLKPGGHLVLVIGNNQVCGEEFSSSKYLAQILQDAGLVLKLKLLDEIRSRGLITKRNKTAGIITKEWVLLFEKPKWE